MLSCISNRKTQSVNKLVRWHVSMVDLNADMGLKASFLMRNYQSDKILLITGSKHYFFFCLGHLIFHINETHNLVNFQNYKCLVHKGRAKIPTSFKIWVPAPHSLYYFVCMILLGKIVLFPMSMYTKLPIDHSSHLNLYKEIGLQSFRVPPTIQEYTIPSIENASKTSKMLSEESLSKRPMKLRFNYLW